MQVIGSQARIIEVDEHGRRLDATALEQRLGGKSVLYGHK